MKWVFYVIVFLYMFYRAVYGLKEVNTVFIDPIDYHDNNYLEVGARKSITCRVSGKNQKADWINPDGEVVKHENTNRVFSQKHLIPLSGGIRVPALLLTISKAEVDDSGKYVCRTDKMSKEVELCVIDPSDFVDTSTEIFVDEGRSFTLSCQARGNPEPRLIWSRDGANIDEDDSSSPKYKVMTKYNSKGFESLLTITSLEPEDSGIYTCVSIQENVLVENCILNKSLNINLHVNYPPTFVDGDTQSVFAKYNDSVELVCAANGFPEPTYRWFHDVGDNTLFEYPKQQINYSEDGGEARLPVTANAITFGQNFTCRVKNDLGERIKVFTIMRLEKPETPSQVTLIYQGSDEIVFSFTSDAEAMSHFDKMEVQYYKTDGNAGKRKTQRDKDTEWRKAKLTELEPSEEYPGMYRLKDLESETNYYTRFRATNELGISSWSKPLLVSTSSTTTTESATESTSDQDAEEQTSDPDSEDDSGTYSDGTFYGLFFAGGIAILAVACMFLMRLV